MKTKPTVGIIAIGLGILVALIPEVIFPVCTDMIELVNGKTLFMKCHWTARSELVIGLLIIFDGILLIGFRKREVSTALSIMLFLLGLSGLLIPTALIGMCKTDAMPCRVGTEPALIVASTIVMVLGIGNTLIQSVFRSEAGFKERSIIK